MVFRPARSVNGLKIMRGQDEIHRLGAFSTAKNIKSVPRQLERTSFYGKQGFVNKIRKDDRCRSYSRHDEDRMNRIIAWTLLIPGIYLCCFGDGVGMVRFGAVCVFAAIMVHGSVKKGK